MPMHIATPLLESKHLSDILGSKVLLKMESLQPSASFKIRGIGHACEKYVNKGAHCLVASSGGNAGYAVAYAGRKLGVKVTVFVPESTSDWMKNIISGEGAVVIEQGTSWDDAHQFASTFAKNEEAAYIHPFDNPCIWEGHASIIKEMDQEQKPGAIVLSVGGGGLLCGVMEGLQKIGWNDVPVIAVETEGAASLARSVEVGHLITLKTIASIAVTLGARTVAKEAYAWTQRHNIIPWVVSDNDALDACFRFADDHRTIVEPACGAALSLIYNRAEPLINKGPTLLIVCGGAGVNLRLLNEWKSQISL